MTDWKRGLNFSTTKYTITGETEFSPYVHSSFRAAIPRQILEKFNGVKEVVLAHIREKEGTLESLRIKRLSNQGNSFTISLKKEKKFKDPVIRIIDIKSEKEALDRTSQRLSIKNFVPLKTANPYGGSTPIYLFNHNNSLVIGGYYKKDLITNDKIEFNSKTSAALGMYLAEGGKRDATFTNSWPDAINLILDFVEETFNFDRTKIKASICCNPSLKGKKRQLERFWQEQTGIANFAKVLHLNKNSKLPQGTLQLYFCSQTLKEILINMINNLKNYDFDKLSFLRGLLSGDGSPILQTKYTITHHIVFDPKTKFWYKPFFNEIDMSKRICEHKIVLYPSWNQNMELLSNDIYKYNPQNRVKFLKRFLNLPATLKSDKDLSNLKQEQKRLNKNLREIYNSLVDVKILNKNPLDS